MFRNEDQDLHNSVCSDLNNLIIDHKIDLQTKSKVFYDNKLNARKDLDEYQSKLHKIKK